MTIKSFFNLKGHENEVVYGIAAIQCSQCNAEPPEERVLKVIAEDSNQYYSYIYCERCNDIHSKEYLTFEEFKKKKIIKHN